MEKENSIPTAKVRIMDVSFAAFNRKGFQAVSMDEVAKELRISKKTIYKYFGSKEELLEVADVTASGYQLYASDMVARIAEIRAMKRKRYTLQEIRAALNL